MAHTEEQIKLVANSILPGFIPKSPDEQTLSFHFTLPPKSYKVNYQKDKSGQWVFISYQEDVRD